MRSSDYVIGAAARRGPRDARKPDAIIPPPELPGLVAPSSPASGDPTTNCPTSSRASRSGPSSERAYAVRDDEAALDIVQDSMIRLAEKYADRPPAELPLLFQRILSNATMDWFRRQQGAQRGGAKLLGLRVRGRRRRLRFAGDSPGCRRTRSAPKAPPTALDGPRSCCQIEQEVEPAAAASTRRRSSCVTGRNSTWPRRPPSWVVPRAASKPTVPGRFMHWRRPLRAKGITP